MNCIKCGVKYETTDVEAYLCPPCLEEKKKIAAEIDKKFTRKSSRSGPSFDEQMAALPKIPGTNIPFIQ